MAINLLQQRCENLNHVTRIEFLCNNVALKIVVIPCNITLKLRSAQIASVSIPTTENCLIYNHLRVSQYRVCVSAY